MQRSIHLEFPTAVKHNNRKDSRIGRRVWLRIAKPFEDRLSVVVDETHPES